MAPSQKVYTQLRQNPHSLASADGYDGRVQRPTKEDDQGIDHASEARRRVCLLLLGSEAYGEDARGR